MAGKPNFQFQYRLVEKWREVDLDPANWISPRLFLPFYVGAFFVTAAIGYLRHGDLFSLESMGAAIGVVAGFFLLILGILGLRNVLRF